ncbi:MAG: lytic murein transglycosylase B, partial [Woeseiaceae bacterium]
MKFANVGIVLLLQSLCGIQAAHALDVERPEVRQFIETMVSTHGYERSVLSSVLEQAETQQSILDAISRPAEKTKAW